MKPVIVKYADGCVGARMRMLCRGDCFPVGASDSMSWKYEVGEECSCGT